MRFSFDIAFRQNDDRLLAVSLEFSFPRPPTSSPGRFCRPTSKDREKRPGDEFARTRYKWACSHNSYSIQKARTDRRLVAEPLSNLQQNYSQLILSSRHHLSTRKVKNSIFGSQQVEYWATYIEGISFRGIVHIFAFTCYVGHELKTLLEDTWRQYFGHLMGTCYVISYLPGLIDRLEYHTVTSSSGWSDDWVIRVIFGTHLKLEKHTTRKWKNRSSARDLANPF